MNKMYKLKCILYNSEVNKGVEVKTVLAIAAAILAFIGTAVLLKGATVGQQMVDAPGASSEAVNTLWHMGFMAGACLTGVLACITVIIILVILDKD